MLPPSILERAISGYLFVVASYLELILKDGAQNSTSSHIRKCASLGLALVSALVRSPALGVEVPLNSILENHPSAADENLSFVFSVPGSILLFCQLFL